MSQRLASNRGRKTNAGRTRTFIWIAGVALIIFLLIYFEQTALLYVLATFGVTGLLLVVAFADLKHAPSAADLPRPSDDAAAIGTGIGSTLPAQPRGASRTTHKS
jgi:hypothetical protein